MTIMQECNIIIGTLWFAGISIAVSIIIVWVRCTKDSDTAKYPTSPMKWLKQIDRGGY